MAARRARKLRPPATSDISDGRERLPYFSRSVADTLGHARPGLGQGVAIGRRPGVEPIPQRGSLDRYISFAVFVDVFFWSAATHVQRDRPIGDRGRHLSSEASQRDRCEHRELANPHFLRVAFAAIDGRAALVPSIEECPQVFGLWIGRAAEHRIGLVLQHRQNAGRFLGGRGGNPPIQRGGRGRQRQLRPSAQQREHL